MQKYIPKGCEVYAMQLRPETVGAVLDWVTGFEDIEILTNSETGEITGLLIGSPETNLCALMTDFILKDADAGNRFSVKKQIDFIQSYKSAE